MADWNFISSYYDTLKYMTTKCHALNITNKHIKQCKWRRQHVWIINDADYSPIRRKLPYAAIAYAAAVETMASRLKPANQP